VLVAGGLITHHRQNEALKKRKAKRGENYKTYTK